MTPSEKLDLANTLSRTLDAALKAEEKPEHLGAEILLLALKARVPMDVLKATFGVDTSRVGYSSL